MPFETPVMIPSGASLVPSTVATPVLMEVQVPPATSSPSVMVVPTHRGTLPVIESGVVLTVNTAEVTHPVVELVKSIVVVPKPTPVAIPVVEPMVAIAVLLLVHVSPPAELNVVVEPIQMAVPENGVGGASMVATAVAETVPHPFVIEYEIVASPPEAPVTFPVVLTVAMPSAPLLQIPPESAPVSVIAVVLPIHSSIPVSVPGFANTPTVTAMSAMAVSVPQALLIVYVIIGTPADTPVTVHRLSVVVIVASAVLEDDHPVIQVVQGVVPVNRMEAPTHTVSGPDIAVPVGGLLSMVRLKLPVHPDELVKSIVVVPPDIPVTTPVAGLTVATDVILLVQVPVSAGVSDMVVLLPIQILTVPLTVGVAFTVTTIES